MNPRFVRCGVKPQDGSGIVFIKPKFYKEPQKSTLLLYFCFSKVKPKDDHVDSLH